MTRGRLDRPRLLGETRGAVAAMAYKLVDLTIGLRVTEEEEREGLDTSSHGEAAYLERVDQAHHRRAVESDRLCELALRHTGVGVDQQQDADTPRRELGHALGEVAEHRLLGKAQAVAQQPGEHAGGQHPAVELVAILFGFQTI